MGQTFLKNHRKLDVMDGWENLQESMDRTIKHCILQIFLAENMDVGTVRTLCYPMKIGLCGHLFLSLIIWCYPSVSPSMTRTDWESRKFVFFPLGPLENMGR